MERVSASMGKNDLPNSFKGFDWKTEEDAFMDGYHQHEKGGEFVTYARLRAMGTNGFQEPATGWKAPAQCSRTTTGVPSCPRGRAGRSRYNRQHRLSTSRHLSDTQRSSAQAALCRRQVQLERWQSHFHGDEVARPPGARQGAGTEEVHRSSSTTAAPTTFGRTHISINRTNSSWIAGLIRSSR